MGWFVVHAFDEVDEVVLVGVGGVAADGVDGGFDVYLYLVNIDVSALGAIGLYVSAGRASGLVTDKKDVGGRLG